MDYFEMAADLPRDSYCLRQTQDQICQTRTQCVHCQLYQEMALPAKYPVPVCIEDTPQYVFPVRYAMVCISAFFKEW